MRNFEPLILDTNEAPIFNSVLTFNKQAISTLGGNNGPEQWPPATRGCLTWQSWCDIPSVCENTPRCIRWRIS